MQLYQWPKAARFGRLVPKSKIYEHANATSRLKDLFVRDIDQIVWAYKLAPETLNLDATSNVSEIQVFQISCRTENVHHDILRAIDRAIPSPIIYELQHTEKTKIVAAYKRPSEADSSKWVVSDHFETEWMPDGSARQALPVVLNLERLYEALLQPLVADHTQQLTKLSQNPAPNSTKTVPNEQSESLIASIERAAAIETQAREVKRIQARLNREKQFNKRVAINAELRDAKQNLERLSSGLTE